MKNLWQKRRELFKHLYVRGTKTEKSVDDEVLTITSSSGQGLEKIRIYGKTNYTPLDLSQVLMENVASSDSYISSGVTGAMAVAIPDMLSKRELTYTPTITGDLGSHSVHIANGSSFLFSSTHALISGGVASPVTIKDYPYIIVTGIVDEADMELVLSSFTIEVSGATLYDIKSLENPLVELYGKNLLNFDQNKYSGAGKVIEKTKDLLTLQAVDSHRSANYKVGIDGRRLNTRKICVSGYFSQTTDETRSCVVAGWYSSTGLGRFNSVGAYSALGGASGKISIKGILNCDFGSTDLTNYALCVALYSNVSGKTDYSTTYVTYTRPMLSLADTDTDYEEYREPTKIQVPDLILASGGGVRDFLEIDRVMGKVILHKLVGTLEIDKGEEEQVTLAKEEIQDFSDTEWAKALLELNVPYGCDGYLWVEGASKIDCEYYTIKNESKYVLMVYYQDQEGNALVPQKIYHVRKGSIYKITPPHISGYVAVSQEVDGIISQNTEITLIYKKEEA
ncbi:MAG: MucBP domain-containing protein [Clostridia bacterium]|nr:MucBP domain-containing protein [Clostridia bacterium]